MQGSTSKTAGQGLLTPDMLVPNHRCEVLLSMVASLAASPSIHCVVGRVFVKRAEPQKAVKGTLVHSLEKNSTVIFHQLFSKCATLFWLNLFWPVFLEESGFPEGLSSGSAASPVGESPEPCGTGEMPTVSYDLLSCMSTRCLKLMVAICPIIPNWWQQLVCTCSHGTGKPAAFQPGREDRDKCRLPHNKKWVWALICLDLDRNDKFSVYV